MTSDSEPKFGHQMSIKNHELSKQNHSSQLVLLCCENGSTSLKLLASNKSFSVKYSGVNKLTNRKYERGSGRGGPDPALPPLFRENPASRTFFISFPNPAFLSHKNTLKSLISTKANKCKM